MYFSRLPSRSLSPSPFPSPPVWARDLSCCGFMEVHMGTTTLHWCFFQLSYRHDSGSLSPGGDEKSVCMWGVAPFLAPTSAGREASETSLCIVSVPLKTQEFCIGTLPILTPSPSSEGEGWGEGGSGPVQSPAIPPRDYLAHRDPKT